MAIRICRLAWIALVAGLLISWGGTGAFAQGPPGTRGSLTLPSTTMGGTITSSSQTDYYEFKATAGLEVTVWLKTESIGSDLAAVLTLCDSNNALLAYNDGEWNAGSLASSRDPILYVKIPETATYYFGVTSASNFHLGSANPGSPYGPYRISLFRHFDSPIVKDLCEPNDSPLTATHITLPFQSQHSNLLYLGDIDWFSIDVLEGEKINVDVDALELASIEGMGIPVKTHVGVFDSSMQPVSAFDTGYDADSGFSGDPSLIFDVPMNGRYYIAVTQAADSGFSTLYQNPDYLQDPYVSGASGVIGYYKVSVRDLQYLCIPQFAIGSFDDTTYKTRILLINPSEQTATGSISLFKSDGTPFAVTFSLPGGSENTYWFSIQPKGQLILEADQEGPGSAGYATIVSTASLAGSAIFAQYDAAGSLITQAAVQASPLMEYFAFPVDIGGDYNTGLAIANMNGSAPVNLYFRLIDTGGNPQAERQLSLVPGEQIALYAGGEGQLFPSLTDFRGSVQVFADSFVSAIALRISPRTLTTLPVLSMDQFFDPTTLIFPDMVSGTMSGKDYRSTMIMTNPSYYPITGTIQFTKPDGTPMPLMVGSTYSSRLNFQIPALGSIFLQPSSRGGFFRGYATVAANHGFGGVLVYSQFDATTGNLETEAGVPASTGTSHFLVPAENQDGFCTGLAVANPTGTDANLLYRLSTDSNPSMVLENGPVPLAAGNQKAQFVSGNYQIFDGFDGTGVLEVISDQQVAAVALRVTATTITMLPVVPIP